jgi:hypothetical protein
MNSCGFLPLISFWQDFGHPWIRFYSMKSIFISGLVLLLAAGSFTQANAQLLNTKVGIKAGMNVSHLSVSGLTDENNIVGYYAGIFARIGLTPCFGIQPEALFSMKGAELNFSNAFAHGDAIFRLNYLDVPVLAVFKFFPHMNLQAGPYFSYLLNASVKNGSTGDGSDFSSEVDKDNFNTVDYGLVAGAGLEFSSLNIGVRYIQGLQPVGKDRTLFGESYNFPMEKTAPGRCTSV